MGFAREASPSSTGTQRVSLKDIADELGISQTAVSFAINDRPGVSAETKRRVKEAAAKLGWTPVYAAQALGSSKTMTIGFAPARSAQGLTDETFMLHFMAGVHTSLSPKGYGLLYRPCRSLNEEMSVYRDWASRKRVDGVILVDLRADDPRPKLLKELGVRAVLAGGPDPNNYVPSLSIDDSRTMGTVLEHLSSLGHRRIAYLSGDSNLDYSQGACVGVSVVRKTAQTGIHQHRVHEFRCRAGRDAYAGDVAFAEASYCIHLRDGNSCRGQSACHGRSIYHRATENRGGAICGLSERVARYCQL